MRSLTVTWSGISEQMIPEAGTLCQDQQISSQKINFERLVNFVTGSWAPAVTFKSIDCFEPLNSVKSRCANASRSKYFYQIISTIAKNVRTFVLDPATEFRSHVECSHWIPALISVFSFPHSSYAYSLRHPPLFAASSSPQNFTSRRAIN